MNRHLIVTIVALFLAAGSAANAASCKFEVNEIDLFTKQHLITTEWYSMTSVMSKAMLSIKFENEETSIIHVAAVREGDQTSLALRIKVSDETNIPITNEDLRDALYVAQGSPLTITLADKSTIVLYAGKNVRGTTRSSSGGSVNSSIVVLYPLGASELDALLEQNVRKISIAATSGRFAYLDSNGRISYKTNKKGRDRFIEALECLNKA